MNDEPHQQGEQPGGKTDQNPSGWMASVRRAINSDAFAACVFYVLAATLFSQMLVSLLIGLIALAGYYCIYKRNPRAIALTVSIVISCFVLNWAAGKIARRELARTHQTDVNHRMLPNNDQMQTNADGIRCECESDDFAADEFNIVFLGDSFVFGEWIENTADVFPYVVERLCRVRDDLPPVRCADFAWTSSSPILSFRLLKDIGARYKPDLVVLSLDMTDFHDDLEYKYGRQFLGRNAADYFAFKMNSTRVLNDIRERFRADDVLNRVIPNKVILPEDRFFVTNLPLEESRLFMEETAANVTKVADHCRDELECRFLLLMLPRHYQYSDKESPDNWERDHYVPLGPYVRAPFEWFRQFAGQAPFPCRSLLPAFENADEFPLYLANDPHWNEAGHRVAARAVLDILIEEDLFK